MVQIRDHHSKSEVLIQSETALNAGERFGSNTSKRTQRCTVLLDTRTSSRQRLQYQEGKIAQILEGCQSLLQYFNVVQMARWVFYKAMDPTLHYKMTVTSRSDPMRIQRPEVRVVQKRFGTQLKENSDADSETPAQKQKQTVVNVDREHRDGCTN